MSEIYDTELEKHTNSAGYPYHQVFVFLPTGRQKLLDIYGDRIAPPSYQAMRSFLLDPASSDNKEL